MAEKRQYHNLRGVVRDIERALREGDYSEVFALIDVLEDVEDARDGIESDAGVEEADDSPGGEPQLALDIQHAADGGALRGPAPGHDPGSDPSVGGSTGVGTPVEHHRRASELAAAGAAAGVVRTDRAVVRRVLD